jgi:AAA domain-containing protein
MDAFDPIALLSTPMDSEMPEPGLFDHRTQENLWAFKGLPGVGKTHQLLEDLNHVLSGGCVKNFCVISQTQFAVKGARNRFDQKAVPKDCSVVAMTLHSLIWKELKRLRKAGVVTPATQGMSPGRSKRPEYFTKPIGKSDNGSLDQYCKEAPSNEREDTKAIQKLFSEYDPFIDLCPNPKMLGDVPASCRFDQSLLFYYLHGTVSGTYMAVKSIHDAKTAAVHRDWVFVDEFQDFSPLQAAALLRYAEQTGCVLRMYGDPNQAMGTTRPLPKLLEIAERDGKVTDIFGDSEYRRCPYKIAELGHKIQPETTAPPEVWANPNYEGIVEAFSCSRSKKYPVARGFSIGESRWAVRTAVGFANFPLPQIALSPEALPRDGTEVPVFSTPFGVKGYEHEVVTIQLWKPKHMKAYRRGCPMARRQLFVSVTRSKGILLIHREMLEMIEECYAAWFRQGR